MTTMKRTTFRAADSEIVLFRGDCIQGMRKRLAGGSVNVVITSPPYNIGVKYSKHDDSRPRREYLEWLGVWADEVKRILADDGSFFLNIGSKPTDPWIPFDVAAVMRERFVLQNAIHWIKSISIDKKDVGDYGAIVSDATVGHFKPIQSKRFLNDCHEYLFHFTKTGDVEIDRLAVGVPYQDKSNIARWKSPKADRRCRGNAWFVPYRTIKSRRNERPHPATFPAELARKAIELHGVAPGLRVCDPFTGIGHAGLGAIECGVDFVGFEIDDDYYKVAVDTLRKAGQSAPSPAAPPDALDANFEQPSFL
jgi:site-specific DNA-methyltransferase (adenine-specific)